MRVTKVSLKDPVTVGAGGWVTVCGAPVRSNDKGQGGRHNVAVLIEW
jgi:hypothetical protein